jgi:hypothetical protein
LSRSIEKIFISKKEEREIGVYNQDPLLIKPKKELLCPPAETNVAETNVDEIKVSSSQPVATPAS